MSIYQYFKMSLRHDEGINCAAEYLECTFCGKIFNINKINNLCTCGKVLFTRYNLEKAKETVVKKSFNKRSLNIWRIAEIMPVFNEKYRFTLGEGWTSLLKLCNLEVKYDLKNLKQKENFENIYFPPSTWIKSKDINFNLILKIKK